MNPRIISEVPQLATQIISLLEGGFFRSLILFIFACSRCYSANESENVIKNPTISEKNVLLNQKSIQSIIDFIYIRKFALLLSNVCSDRARSKRLVGIYRTKRNNFLHKCGKNVTSKFLFIVMVSCVKKIYLQIRRLWACRKIERSGR